MQQIKAGKLRALAVGGEQRRKAMPDVPTMGELGYPGFEIEGWLGVFVPAGTPKEIVTKLSDELAGGKARNPPGGIGRAEPAFLQQHRQLCCTCRRTVLRSKKQHVGQRRRHRQARHTASVQRDRALTIQCAKFL